MEISAGPDNVYIVFDNCGSKKSVSARIKNSLIHTSFLQQLCATFAKFESAIHSQKLLVIFVKFKKVKIILNFKRSGIELFPVQVTPGIFLTI